MQQRTELHSGPFSVEDAGSLAMQRLHCVSMAIVTLQACATCQSQTWTASLICIDGKHLKQPAVCTDVKYLNMLHRMSVCSKCIFAIALLRENQAKHEGKQCCMSAPGHTTIMLPVRFLIGLLSS